MGHAFRLRSSSFPVERLRRPEAFGTARRRVVLGRRRAASQDLPAAAETIVGRCAISMESRRIVSVPFYLPRRSSICCWMASSSAIAARWSK